MKDEAINDTRTPRGRAARNACRSLASLAAMICAAAVITACGAGSRPSGATTGGDPAMEYARCLRASGVPNFPDPSPHDGLVIPNDINPQSPAFRSAQQACGKLAQGGAGHGGGSESGKLELLALARCMRAHKVANFPDPTSSPPPPSSGNVLGGNGAYLALGTPQEQQSPAYKNAAAACGSPAKSSLLAPAP